MALSFILKKTILCDDRYPPWMNDLIKYLRKKENSDISKTKTVKHSQLYHLN